jgi:hypothetical protein
MNERCDTANLVHRVEDEKDEEEKEGQTAKSRLRGGF